MMQPSLALHRAWNTKTVALCISENTASAPVWTSCRPTRGSRRCLKRSDSKHKRPRSVVTPNLHCSELRSFALQNLLTEATDCQPAAASLRRLQLTRPPLHSVPICCQVSRRGFERDPAEFCRRETSPHPFQSSSQMDSQNSV